MFFTPQLSALLYLHLPVCLIWASRVDHNSTLNRVAGTFGTGSSLRWMRASQAILLRGLGVVLVVYATCLSIWDSDVYETKLLFDSGKIAEAVKAFARARKIAPPSVTAEAWFSRELINNDDSTAGQSLNALLYQSLRISIEHEEEFGNSYILLAATMIRDGRSREAELVLKRAVLAFPNWPLPKTMLTTVDSNTNGAGH